MMDVAELAAHALVVGLPALEALFEILNPGIEVGTVSLDERAQERILGVGQPFGPFDPIDQGSGRALECPVLLGEGSAALAQPAQLVTIGGGA